MNESFVARAPGKLFLLGEYAVLDGGPALVAAVNRHVEVRLRRTPACRASRVTAPGHAAPFELSPGRAAPAELRFAVAALDAAMQRLQIEAAFELEIGSELEQGANSGQKLGLGGSAAVTAAVIAAVYAAAGGDVEARRDEIFATAYASHRRTQGGVGSGADVAASVYGGLLRVERAEDASVGESAPPPCPSPGDRGRAFAVETAPPTSPARASSAAPRVRRVEVPAGFALLVAWSGVPAATAPLVQRYLALGEARAAFTAASRASVEAFVAGLAGGRVDSAQVNRNGGALESLARGSDLPLLTPELERILSLAREAGAGAKLSGAGGGDCAIALTDDAATAARVTTAWRDAGVQAVDLRLQTGGVSVGQG